MSEKWENYWKREKTTILQMDLLSVFNKYSFKDGLVLEVGCGSGTYLLELAKSGRVIVGLDFALSALELTKKRFKNTKLTPPLLVYAEADHIPIKNECVNTIIYDGVIEHQKPQMTEAYRALKTGGYLIVKVPWKFSLIYYAYWLKRELVDKACLGKEHPFTRKEIISLIKSLKMRLVEVKLVEKTISIVAIGQKC
jgi:ubiquinone/menaquinone biosynthesis C-methylase UbiE